MLKNGLHRRLKVVYQFSLRGLLTLNRSLSPGRSPEADAVGEAVNYVGPGTVFPVHCEEPELFRKYYGSVTLPEIGKEYRV